jgi:hypothetical protein
MNRLRGVHFLASAISRSDPPPLNFFLRDFVKDEVYVPPMPITPDKLKDRIRTAIAEINDPLLQSVWHEFEYRSDLCRAY